jgi:hypothetical protein
MSRSITAFALVALAVAGSMLVVALAFAQDPAKDDQEIYAKFQGVAKLRADGDYEGAIAELRQIVAEYTASHQILRVAYNHLVTTYIHKDDEIGAVAAAREALEKFPDLVAEEITFPADVNWYYDTLRKEMFGSLTINKPKDCRVFLDGEHKGDTPLRLKLVRVGEHDLKVTKSGYHDFTERISIGPDVALDKEPSLAGKRGLKWWGYRIGAGVVAVTLLAVGLSGGDEAPPAEPATALDDPPPPPGN